MKSRYVYSLTPVYAAAERCVVKHLKKIRFYGSRNQTLDEAMRTPMTTQDLLRITHRVSAYTKELINELVRYYLYQHFLSATGYDEGELIYKSAMVVVGEDPEEIEEIRNNCFEAAIREIRAIVDLLPDNRYLVAKIDIKNSNLYVTTGEDVRILQYELDHGRNTRWNGQLFDIDGRVYDDLKPLEMELDSPDAQSDEREADTLLAILSQEAARRNVIEDSFQDPLIQEVSTHQPEHVRPAKSTLTEEALENEASDEFIELEGLSLYADQE